MRYVKIQTKTHGVVRVPARSRALHNTPFYKAVRSHQQHVTRHEARNMDRTYACNRRWIYLPTAAAK
ncbi:MAG: hypothetical protein HS116_24945 [Planctomycetes bacterium]|nr:hypothetical protein [Planctomycetota bacterium]